MLVAATTLLALTSPLLAQSAAAPVADYSTAVPLAGVWTYRATAGGSEAAFVTSGNQPQLALQCARVTRTITIAKAAATAAPHLAVWTSSASRSLPATYLPATARVSATLSVFDPLMDALSFSRGRVAFAVGGAPALVTPAAGEIARVIEDCRS